MLRVLLRRDTVENFMKANPVLKKHEIVKVFFTNEKPRFKIGDGVHKFSELSYVDKLVFDVNTPFITGSGNTEFSIRFDVNLDGSLPDGTL